MSSCGSTENAEKEYIQSLYGENRILESADSPLAVKCSSGTFVGLQDGSVVTYKGIPYAEQPVGSLRWKPVQMAADGDVIREAYYFGKSCIQTEAESERASYYPQGEDCLSLNIWLNSKNKSEDKPVMVFIHGGAYGWGGTADPLYDGYNLVNKFDDIILVTINYRIGILGFIDLSAFEGGEEYRESGNLGLLDQIEALKWIKRNIAAFGGDPENITIFGESAGAGSASLLCTMPQAKGLFKRVIAESGAPSLTFSREDCSPLTEQLKEDSGADSMDDLLALTEEELKVLNEPLNDYFNNYPERDGVVLPSDLQELLDLSAASDIDFMTGTNAAEANYWINEMGGYLAYSLGIPVVYESNMIQIDDASDRLELTELVNSMEGTITENYSEFFDEVMFRMPAIKAAESHSKSGGRTYMYYWKYPSGIRNLGACHAVELAYVFNNLDETIFSGDNIDGNLADKVQNMWVNFARNGDPGVEDLSWPVYNTDTRYTMILDSELSVEKDPMSEQREILMPMIDKYQFKVTYSALSLGVPSLMIYLSVIAGVVILLIWMIFFSAKKKRQKRNTDEERI